MNKFICVLTIHGIGFEEPPHNGIPGYADSLHTNLRNQPDTSMISGDPQRPDGPIYVKGHVHSNSKSMRPTLTRLGNKLTRLGQENDKDGEYDISAEKLAEGNATIVHIALVYTPLEGKRAGLGSLLQLVIMAASNLHRYARLTQIIRRLVRDIMAMFKPPTPDNRLNASTLRVRTDDEFRPVKGKPPKGFTVFRQVENDVAAYVYHNDERERVRNFVGEVISQLANRGDVEGIVINVHSNGTVVAFDALRDLPPNITEKILWFITAGSPLLKYTELFHWGSEVGSIQKVGTLTNFWDKKDPVADSLSSKNIYKYPIHDEPVNNVKYSSGSGLRAHNYWDNNDQFIKQLSEGLNDLLMKHPLSYPAAS